MRFDFVAKTADDGWQIHLFDHETGKDYVDPQSGTALLPDGRRLRRCGVSPNYFPVPDPAVLAVDVSNSPTDGDIKALCDAADERVLDTALSDLLSQAGAPGSVKVFGRYLFVTLIGNELWQRIDACAGTQSVELALCWADNDVGLNRLPWETLCSPKGFLASEPQIAITRRVKSTALQITLCPSTPRVLFVVGSPLSDRVIKPGAEYLGLLRALDCDGLYLQSHLLLEATPGRLQAAIKSFRPHVVHFICHGVAHGEAARLQLVDDNNLTQIVEMSCAALVSNLETDLNLPLPQAVVLSACATATSDELTTGRPFAAELVSSGIPMVIGMSGDIADTACRMFSKGFYRALLKGGDATTAAALGRRAAICYGGYDPASRLDWALPAVFLAARLTETRLSKGAAGIARTLHDLAHEIAPTPFPGFCDRFELLQDFSVFLAGRESHRERWREPKLVFAVSSPEADGDKEDAPRYGRTWLLRELAACAIRSGHIACLVEKNSTRSQGWPSDGTSLVNAIAVAAQRTAVKLKIAFNDFTWGPQNVMRVLDWQQSGNAPTDLPQEITSLRLQDEDFSRRFAAALRFDLSAMLASARAVYPEELHAGMRLLLLIDDVHRMSEAAKVLIYEIFGLDGIGGAQAEDSFRIVMTYAEKPDANQQNTIKMIEDWRGKTHGVLSGHLRPFSVDVDFDKGDRLPYKQFLLNWHDLNRATRQSIARPLTIGEPEKSSRMLDIFFSNLAGISEGVPSRLALDRSISVLIKNGIDSRFLREAADDDALKQALETNLRGG
jgi:CHAT domain